MKSINQIQVLILFCLFLTFSFSLKAEDAPCEVPLALAPPAHGLIDNSQLSLAGKNAFATYVKNAKIYNSTFFSKAIVIELMGDSYWVSKNQVIQRLRMLPSISDAERLKAMSKRITLIFLELFNDDFKMSDTSSFLKMAKVLGVEQKELHLILSNWRADKLTKESLDEVSSMVEYLLIHEAERLEFRIRNLPISILLSFSYGVIRKRVETWEILLNPEKYSVKRQEWARNRILKSLEGRVSSKLRELALQVAGKNEVSSNLYLMGDVNPKILSLFEIPNDQSLSYDYLLTKILNNLKAQSFRYSMSDLIFILNSIGLKFKVRSYAGADMFYAAMVEDGKKHSLMLSKDIPTQLELIYLILKNLDFSTVSNLEEMNKIASHVLTLSTPIVVLGRESYFRNSMNSAENRADILDYIKYYVEKRLKDFEAFQRGIGTSIDAKIQKRLPFDGASFSASDVLDRSMADLKVAVQNWVPNDNSNVLMLSPLGQIKLELGKLHFADSSYSEGISYSFEDLPSELQDAIQEKSHSKELEFTIWAFSDLKADAFRVFSADYDFIVKFKPMNDYY